MFFALKKWPHRVSFWDIRFMEKEFLARSTRKLKCRLYKIALCSHGKAVRCSVKLRNSTRMNANTHEECFLFTFVVRSIRIEEECYKYPRSRLASTTQTRRLVYFRAVSQIDSWRDRSQNQRPSTSQFSFSFKHSGLKECFFIWNFLKDGCFQR